MQDVERAKARFAQLIEDGRKIEVFTSMPEWKWYVEQVVQPTIDEHTGRIMRGEIKSNKEDWIMRGIVQGMQLMIDTPENFRQNAEVAKKKAKDLNKYIKATEDERDI